MKKIIYIVAAVVLSLFCFSCTDTKEDEKIITVEPHSGYVTLHIPFVENASYLNVFRKDSSDNVLNLGQIIPADNVSTSYGFDDTLVLDGEEYQYSVRYRIANEYKSLNWSDTVTGDSSYTSSDPCPGTTGSDLAFIYDEDLSSLTLSGSGSPVSVDVPAALSTYHLGLVVNNGSSRTVFKLVPTAGTSYSSTSTPVSLTSLFSSGYFNKPVEIEGVVCQLVSKKYSVAGDDTSDLRYTTIFWSAPLALDVYIDGETQPAETITVNLSTSDDDNYDYSERALLLSENSVEFDY